jgi:Tol biopolymer transport system component/alpha-beta hydrolase superfamily lysophospholipase
VQRAAGRWEQLQAASVYVMRPDGTGLRTLTPPGRFAGSPKWSPDGKRVVFYDMDVKDTFAARRNFPGSVPPVSQIASMDVVTAVRQEHSTGAGLKVSPQYVGTGRIGYVIKEGPRAGLAFTSGERGATGQIRNPSWSPDGNWVVYQKYSSLAWPQNQTLFSRDPEFDLVYSDPFPAFSRDGKKLALSDKLGSTVPGALAALSVMDPDGSNVKHIFQEKDALVVMPEWSPNGDRIAFGAGYYFGNGTKPAKLLMVRPDGSELHELTSGPANTGFPSWSPDGKRIVYRVWSESERGLRIINLEDHSSRTLTTGYDNFPSWSPRGDVIAFTSFRDGDFDIYTIRPDGTGLQRLTTAPGNDAHPVWSPDGAHILFSSSRLGFKDEAPLYDAVPQPYAELFVMNADGSGQRPLTDNQWEEGTPAWEPHVGALAAKPAEDQGRGDYAQVYGFKMYYEVRGEGRPVVLLHGGMNTIQTSFAKQIPVLARNHRIIAIEQMGHGHTPDVQGRELSYESLAQDTAALLTQLGIQNADMVGWSDGGQLALRLAFTHPELVRRVVVSGVGFGATTTELQEAVRTLSPDDRSFKRAHDEYTRVSPDGPQHWPILFEKGRAMWAKPSWGISQPELARIKAPTLIVAGDLDVLSVEETTHIFRSIPDAKLCILPGTEHETFQTRPDWLNPIILDFLDRN